MALQALFPRRSICIVPDPLCPSVRAMLFDVSDYGPSDSNTFVGPHPSPVGMGLKESALAKVQFIAVRTLLDSERETYVRSRDVESRPRKQKGKMRRPGNGPRQMMSHLSCITLSLTFSPRPLDTRKSLMQHSSGPPLTVTLTRFRELRRARRPVQRLSPPRRSRYACSSTAKADQKYCQFHGHTRYGTGGSPSRGQYFGVARTSIGQVIDQTGDGVGFVGSPEQPGLMTQLTA
ncbi:hypothetical protein B0H19DRAFT_1241342 [Mycena capillaripes]|nr:hypothetical protein B0H19DRAFT_1241342 [Mycena capillaripes]